MAIAADIYCMFHQVLVDENDRNALLFLWWPEGNLDAAPVVYCMNVFPFGTICSPYCTAFTLRQTAKENVAGASASII